MDSKIFLREIEYKDRLEFKKWGTFDDPLLFGYNYSTLSNEELEFWYLNRKKGFFNRTYGAFHEESGLIGYIAIKKINPITKTGLLGIVFDANNVSKGYGYEAMMKFLDIYFNKLRMRKLDLEVNSFNTRARKLYEKLGFKIINESYERFENQEISKEYLRERNIEDDFFYVGKTLFSKIYKMRLER